MRGCNPDKEDEPMPDEETAAALTPGAQVTADANVMQSARNQINTADIAIKSSTAGPTLKNTLHAALASVAGILQTGEATAQAWVKANPPAVTPPPVTPPPPVNPPPPPVITGHRFGICSINDLMWTKPGSYPIAQMQKIGATVCRSQLAMDAGGWDGYDGTQNYPISSAEQGNISGWTKAMNAAGIQPLIVCTFATLQDTATMATAMATLAKTNPGTWWEWGNELEYQAKGITAPQYVTQFAQIVAAVSAADPTALIGPAPVENITSGQQGWTAMQQRATAGLFKIPFHFLPHHNYGDTPAQIEALIAPWIAYCKGLGNTAPHWETECGWGTGPQQDTEAVQEANCMAYLASAAVQALPVVTPYELFDDDSNLWGWLGGGVSGGRAFGDPKPVYTAFAALAASKS
jgi:hypothetical protein